MCSYLLLSGKCCVDVPVMVIVGGEDDIIWAEFGGRLLFVRFARMRRWCEKLSLS